MTDLDLEPFRRKVAQYRDLDIRSLTGGMLWMMAEGARALYMDDVPLLLAEIERLRLEREHKRR